MRLTSMDGVRVTCDAEIDVSARRVRRLLIDDADPAATMMGLSVLAGCIAAILQDVKLGGKTLEQAGRDHAAENAGELRTEVEL